MEQIRKISVKTVCGKPAKPEAVTPLMRVGGIINKMESVETAYGESIRFRGQFAAINLDTGEEFRSNVAFLPGILSDMLQGADGFSDSIEFLVDVALKPADNNVGYEYGIKSLVEPKAEDDPINRLFANAPELPKLAAPATGKGKGSK